MAHLTEPEIVLQIQTWLAEILDLAHEATMTLPETTPLFGGGLGLDSLTGMMLVTRVGQKFNIDLGAEDLHLESLETIGSLATYLARRDGG